MTEAYPTNFHRFFRRKVLTASESADDWREVTDAEREAIEKADAAWSEPPRLFVDLWRDACGRYGTYNEATGFFELNGLTDIGYEEAVGIYGQGTFDTRNIYGKRFSERTHLPFTYDPPANGGQLFDSDDFKLYVEVANMQARDQHSGGEWIAPHGSYWSTPFGTGKLRRIEGVINMQFYTAEAVRWFTGATGLEHVRLKNLPRSIDLLSCGRLTFDSFRYIVDNSGNGTEAISITVHPDVFARLTDESDAGYAQWHPLVDQAAAKNITFKTR